MGGQSARWTVALLLVVAAAVLTGTAVWLLSTVVWHWQRSDVIAIASGATLGVAALGLAPAQAWVGSPADRRRRGVIEIVRSRSGRHIVAQGKDIRVDRSSAAGDIRATQPVLPPRGAVEREDDVLGEMSGD